MKGLSYGSVLKKGFTIRKAMTMERTTVVSILSVILLTVLLPIKSTAHPGWGIVVDMKGQVYFGDVNRNIVWKIDTQGKVTPFVRGKHSHTLHIDEEGNVYGDHVEYDQKNDRWLSHRWMATPDGQVSILGSKRADEIFSLIDSNGNKYLFSGDAHKRIAKVFRVSPAGDTTLFAGGTWGDADGKGTQAQFRTFGPAVWGPDHCLYFGSGGIIRKLALDGTVTTLAGRIHGFGDPDEPRASGFLGITVDKDGTVYAAHPEKRKVIKITPGGKVMTVLEGGLGWAPSGVMLVGSDLYVLEHRFGVLILTEKVGFGGPRVRKVTSDAKITTVGVAR